MAQEIKYTDNVMPDCETIYSYSEEAGSDAGENIRGEEQY